MLFRSSTNKPTLSLKELRQLAYDIRIDIIQALTEAKSGHAGGPLGMAEVFTALYFHILNIDPKRPDWPERDRLVLSCGHICPVLYATLARRGFCDRSQFIKTLRKKGSPFQGHPNNHGKIGIETSSGPLAQGYSQAIGMALTARLTGARWRTYLIGSDGELNEGQTWEAIMFAGKERLGNLTCIIDRNNIQIDGNTEDIMPLEPLADKWRAFNWHVIEVDGHNLRGIIDAYKQAEAITDQPTVILAHTTPGKGVSFMERNYEWHGKVPNKEEAARAIAELEQAKAAL
ncbi:transketolase [Patescibacteria group bacterium]|nr:transketolase [Patescibacteria group bacterium]